MPAKHSKPYPAVPFFGVYIEPNGSKRLLCRPSDVYDLFRSLLTRMPSHAQFHDRTKPELGRFRRIGSQLVKLP